MLSPPAPSGALSPVAPARGHAPILVIEHVDKSFPATNSLVSWVMRRGRIERRRVLHDVDFSVGRAELFGLLGPNGAGKTSLLKMLATLSIPDRGRILLDGIDVVRAPLAAKARIGLCPAEERSFYFRLTAWHNLEFFGALEGLRGRALRERVAAVTELVDLGPVIHRPFNTFSSGMRQRLAVARALLADPDVLFFDEPTRAVDPVHADALRRLIRDELVRKRGKTVVLATNILEEAWSTCDRIAVIDAGRIVALAPPGTLSATLRQRVRYRIVVQTVVPWELDRVGTLPGVAALEVTRDDDALVLDVELDRAGDALSALLRELLAYGAIRSVREVEPEPMEVFAHVTGRGESV